MERIFYVYFRELGKLNKDWHVMLVEATNTLEAKNKVRRILDTKTKKFTIQFITEEYIEMNI